ncbi:thioredoxin domain-containing protein [Actinomadura sp. NPDC047616]|uniref:DsbA family protein n=1 Tax=Actinomadura sp. NPDC047616 TaxID=3155914 RepID=UPI0033F22A91
MPQSGDEPADVIEAGTDDERDGRRGGPLARLFGGRSRPAVAVAAAIVVLGVMAFAALTRDGDRTSDRADGQAGIPEVEAPSSPSPNPTPTVTWAGPTPPPADPALFKGSDNAPVTIVEFGDFQCPKCGTFARRTKPELTRRYIDTGVVRLIWRDFPTFGKESMRAAVASRAAARQGRFWQFHDALYARQPRMNSGEIDDAFLRDVARRAGLDLARFDADRRDKKVRGAVEDDFAFGQRLGVPGTPAFLINGEPFFGAQPLSAFEQAIQKARAAR